MATSAAAETIPPIVSTWTPFGTNTAVVPTFIMRQNKHPEHPNVSSVEFYMTCGILGSYLGVPPNYEMRIVDMIQNKEWYTFRVCNAVYKDKNAPDKGMMLKYVKCHLSSFTKREYGENNEIKETDYLLMSYDMFVCNVEIEVDGIIMMNFVNKFREMMPPPEVRAEIGLATGAK